MGMSSFLRSLGDCRISFSGSGVSRMSHGLMYSYLAKKSVMSHDQVFDQRQVRQRLDGHHVGVHVRAGWSGRRAGSAR